MRDLLSNVAQNAAFVLEFLAIIAILFVVAFVLERIAAKKNDVKEPIFTTRKIAMIGMFSAVSVILMLFEIPLPFAPGFYKLDFSELPILIGTFAFGPAAGVMMEFIKILLKLLIKGTSTAFVGELANFAVGCSFIIPASVVYAFKKTKVNAIIACLVGALSMAIFGSAFNALYLLPAFAALYGMPIDALIAMGAEVNPLVKEGNMVSFVVACVAPLNFLKGFSVSLITLLVYKQLSPIIKQGRKN
ncbi:MAG: ECF transporter S component [Acetatifactor sp.]|nr:ECF transporter S component [Acetatifactor sp.]